MYSRHSLWFFCLLMGWLLQACSAYAPPTPLVGMDRNAVVMRFGAPETERQTPNGTRMEFPSGPYGRQTWFVYLDAAGIVTRAEQVLTEENFRRVDVGMAQDQVRQLLGRPGEVQLLGRERGMVWSYRYLNYDCTWFQVELSLQQQVRSAGFAPRPECMAPKDPRSPS